MAQDKSKKNLLIISDAISAQTGLARIARDLAVRVHEHLSDVYRLAVAGNGSPGSCKFPFPQYNLQGLDGNWVIPSLPEIVQDFAGNEHCTLMFVWDLSRLGWFAQPDRLGAEALASRPGLAEWIKTANISKWCYTPIDATGPRDRLTMPLAITALGFDRLLAYGPFGEEVLRASIGDEEANKRHLTNLPHGIDSSVFYERTRKLSRRLFFEYTGAKTMLAMLGVNPKIDPLAADEILINIVATNQSRKDWFLGLHAASILAKYQKVRVWAHTDDLERYWSIPSLLVDLGLLEKTVISTGYLSDDRMAVGYSASDIGFGVGPEGFGFTLAESMACGTPCITGNCANNPALVNAGMLVDPVAFRYEGSYACKRPVYNAEDWAKKAEEWCGKRASFSPRYAWDNLWPNEWESWFRKAA